MSDKHGDWTCAHLKLWEKYGFPINGSLSVNQIERLERQLENAETKEKRKNVGWKAFGTWKTEALLRDIQKNRHSKGGGNNIQCAKLSTGKVDQDLDCLSGEVGPPPYVPPNAAQPDEPPVVAQPEASGRLYPPLPLPGLKAPTTPPMSTRLRSGGGRDLLTPTSPTSSKCQTPILPESSNWPLHGAEQGQYEKVYPMMPMVEVANPRAAGTMYVFRPWTAADLRDVMEGMPNPSESGGAEFGAQLLELIQQHRPTTGEIKRLVVIKNQLKWGVVQGDWPEEDTPYDWADGSAYRIAVAGLVQRLRDYYAKRMDWGIVRDCVQKSAESVTDYRLRLSKIFRVHSGLTPPADPNVDSPYEQQEKNFFVEGLCPDIKKLVQKHCVTLDTGRLADVLAHARHAEKVVARSEEKVDKKKERLGNRLQMAQLQTYEQKLQYNRGRGRRGRRGRGQRRAFTKNRPEGCFRCGSFNHWVRDCPEPEESEEDREQWQFRPETGVTVTNPGARGRGGRGRGGY